MTTPPSLPSNLAPFKVDVGSEQPIDSTGLLPSFVLFKIFTLDFTKASPKAIKGYVQALRFRSPDLSIHIGIILD
ncbi:hypothetical protein PVK06_000232 [Gossypium arboreum]|uniref:Uncharacterized protein n=1 Tax=Gossypium arboreum TaxID=29729 RepID=A0ABR0QYU6_GOSAR|nr:hypothetical protein PVK06_000232 [Gossypium arboreum]